MNAIAATNATASDKVRKIAVNVTPFQGRDATLTSAVGLCDDSDLRGSCD
jgi:hypothetical protein